MKNLNWIGLGTGIFFGGAFGFVITRYFNLDIGLNENTIVFIGMFLFGLIGKKLGDKFVNKSRLDE